MQVRIVNYNIGLFHTHQHLERLDNDVRDVILRILEQLFVSV
jgi:hypothetical protein